MRKKAAVLLVMLGAPSAWEQDAPLQSGPMPGTVVTDAPDGGGAAGGYSMEPGMTAPKIVQAMAAMYPTDPPGFVSTVRCTLSMVISAEGMPLFIRVAHSAGEEYDSAAILAVRQSKFEAGLRDQKAVPIRTQVRVAFTADHNPAMPEIVKPTYRGSGDAIKADYPPQLLRRVDPEYSEEARKKKIQGSVVVTALVSVDGMVTEVRVDRGIGYGLDEKAMDAIRQYKFRSAMKDGNPIPQHITIQVQFQLF